MTLDDYNRLIEAKQVEFRRTTEPRNRFALESRLARLIARRNLIAALESAKTVPSTSQLQS
jgi:hypothetical protein